MDVVCKLFLRFCKFLANSFDILSSSWRHFSHVFNKVSTVVCTPSLSSVFLATVGSYSAWDSTRGQKTPIMNRQNLISSDRVSLPTVFILNTFSLKEYNVDSIFINRNILVIAFFQQEYFVDSIFIVRYRFPTKY